MQINQKKNEQKNKKANNTNQAVPPQNTSQAAEGQAATVAVGEKSSLLTLFVIFFKIGLFTFGGGLAMLPLIENAIVDKKHWMTNRDFVEMLAVVNSLPGAFAINTSIFIGYRRRGLSGAVTAALGTMLPSFMVILVVAWLLLQGRDIEWLNKFFLGVRPVVVALLIDAGIRIWKSTIKEKSDILLVVVGTLAVAIAGINAVFVLLAGAAVGLTWYRRILLQNQKEVK